MSQCDAGDIALLPLAEEALRKVHRCSIMVNDVHPDNIVLVVDDNMTRVFFADFSHSITKSCSVWRRAVQLACCLFIKDSVP